MLHVHSLTVTLQLWESFTLCGSCDFFYSVPKGLVEYYVL